MTSDQHIAAERLEVMSRALDTLNDLRREQRDRLADAVLFAANAGVTMVKVAELACISRPYAYRLKAEAEARELDAEV